MERPDLKEQFSKMSTPVKIGGGAGIFLIVVLLGFTILKSHPKATTAVTAAPVAPITQHVAKGAKQVIQLTPGLPPALRVALRTHPVVVAVVSGSRKGDVGLISSARLAAKTAHAGFAVLNVGDEMVARQLATFVSGVPISSVLLFTRPGTIAEALPGYSDTDTLAQAASDTKHALDAPPVATTPVAPAVAGAPVAPTTTP